MARATPVSLAQSLLGQKGFLDPPHIRLICRELVRSCHTGQNLIIEMPPRHGKSTTISKAFPVWFLNEWPDKRIVLASYEADFAATWGRAVRDLIESHQDKLRVSINRKSSAANRWDTTRGGGMVTAGVQGPITGKGAHVFIIDDPVKNHEQAMSSTFQEKTWDWWQSVALTRQEPGCFYVILMTRWTDNDLAGKVIEHDRKTGANRWKVISIPALAEDEGDPLGRNEGEALWPERYTREKLLEIKQDVGSHKFAALYQQRPTAIEGGLFKRAWFNYWYSEDSMIVLRKNDGTTTKVSPTSGYRFTTTDPAISTKQTADYTVISEWLHLNTGELLLMNEYRQRIESPEVLQLHRTLWNRGGLSYMGVESNAYQATIFQQLSRPQPGQTQLIMREIRSSKDKVTRALPVAALMESGKFYLPRDNPDLSEIENEYLHFPNGKHDDRVDTGSSAAELISTSPHAGGALQMNNQGRPSPWRT